MHIRYDEELDILDASKRYTKEALSAHPARYDRPIQLVDAARMLSVTPQALQKAIVRGRLKGEKVGNTWTSTIEAINEYSNSRVHTGPKSPADTIADPHAAEWAKRRLR